MHCEDWARPVAAHLLIGRLLRDNPAGLTTYRLQKQMAAASASAGLDDDATRPMFGRTLVAVVLACKRLEESGVIEHTRGPRQSKVWRLTRVGAEWLDEQLDAARLLLGLRRRPSPKR